MQEFIESTALNERKKKQTYLIKNIIEQSHDPDAFSQFLHSQRQDGEDIDNWTIEELESMVALYKRSVVDTSDFERFNFLLEDLELSNSDEYVYAKRYKMAKKKKTVLSATQAYIFVEGTEVKDVGLFSGKQIIFTVSVPELELKVRRTDAEFKWLLEYLAKEFPFTPLPPMMTAHDKTFDPAAVNLTRKYFEKFLNECVKHADMRSSLALEIFLVAQTKEEMAMRTKDIQTFFGKNLILNKVFTKKAFDAVSKDVLKMFPTANGVGELKISATLKNYIKCSEGQFAAYEALFEKLEKLHGDFDRYHKKLMGINTKIKDTLSELQSASVKFNASKPFRSRYNIMEDTLFSVAAAYFDNYDKVLEEQKNLYKKHVGDYARYTKEYISNMRAVIDQRNALSGEYFKAKFALDERKYKRLTSDKSQWDIDADLCKIQQLDVDVVKSDVEIAKRFMISDVS